MLNFDIFQRKLRHPSPPAFDDDRRRYDLDDDPAGKDRKHRYPAELRVRATLHSLYSSSSSDSSDDDDSQDSQRRRRRRQQQHELEQVSPDRAVTPRVMTPDCDQIMTPDTGATGASFQDDCRRRFAAFAICIDQEDIALFQKSYEARLSYEALQVSCSAQVFFRNGMDSDLINLIRN